MARFFAQSTIRERFEEGSLGLPSRVSGWPLCMVGDAVFPLCTYLMGPYPGRNLTEKKKVFNYRLSRARRCVENAFGILVSRWRAFLATTTGQPELLEEVIKAAVCLHNFLMCDSAYCPSGYCDNVCGENVTEGSLRETVTACAIGASNSRPSPSTMALRDEIAEYFMSNEGSLPWQLRVVRRC